MSLPEPFMHPEETEEQEFWDEDGVWWNADCVNGGTREIRVYGREYQTDGSKLIRWVIDTDEDDLNSLAILLKNQAGEDAEENLRELSFMRATEQSQAAGGETGTKPRTRGPHPHFRAVGGSRRRTGGEDDPIKSIKGIGTNRASESTSCSTGDSSACSADLTTSYPRSPA